MKKVVIILIYIFSSCFIAAQQPYIYTSTKSAFWKPTSFTGEIKLGSNFRTKQIITDYINDTQNSTLLSAGLKLNSESYFWNPNFIGVSLTAEYNPDIIKEKYIIIPNRNEVITMKHFGMRTSIFKNKNINLNTNTDFSQTYNNRENLSNIKTDIAQIGALLNIKNKILPLSFSYNKSNLIQNEIETERISSMNQTNIKATASKSFYKIDKHDFTYSRNEYRYNNFNIFQSHTISENFNLNDNFYFDKKQNYNFRSLASYQNQTGNTNFERFQLNENLYFKLPAKLIFNANYNQNNINQELIETKSRDIRTSLRHKLYQSLTSSVFYDYSNVTNTYYTENNQTYGFDIYYTKRIPLKGVLNLSGGYQSRNNSTTSQPADIQIINEEHYLSDATIEMLDKPNADILSVVVKDATGAIIYIENLDYILIQRNEYIEIQRFPGGQISDNSSILIDYIATQPASYNYNAALFHFESNLKLWNKIFEIYFNTSKQDFYNISNTEFLSLNYYTQSIFGVKMDFNFVNFGIETENYNSTIVPYNSVRYFINFQKNINDRILISLAGNIRNNKMPQENVTQQFSDISAKAVYLIQNTSNISADVSYRNQSGYGIDLNLLAARVEFKTQIRDLNVSLGMENYYRNFMGEKTIYQGVFFKLIRKF